MKFIKLKIKKIKKIFAIVFLLILPLLSFVYPNIDNYYNNLLTKLEIYYNSNNITEFGLVLEKVTKYAIDNRLIQNLQEFIKNKIINKEYKNPLINEKIADTMFLLGDIETSQKIYQTILNYLNFNSSMNITYSIASRIFYKMAQNDLLNGSIEGYLQYLNLSYLYERDISKKLDLKIQIIKDKTIYTSNLQEIQREIKDLVNYLPQVSIQEKEKIYISLAEVYSNLNLENELNVIIENILPFYNSLESLSIQYEYSRNKQKQKEILEKIIQSYPKADPYYFEKLGNIYYGESNFIRAKDLYLAVINRIPTKPQVLYRLALIYFNENKIYEAAKYIALAIKQQENPEYYELAGDIYAHLDLKKALDFYQKAYELHSDIPSKANVRKKITNLKEKFNK